MPPAVTLGLLAALTLVSCTNGSSTPAGTDAAGGGSDATTGGGTDAPGGGGGSTEKFSFFVTSMATMKSQSNNEMGFGGNFGGLAGADKICQNAAAAVGFGNKTWRAFLSAYNNGTPIHAIDRVGEGPWYSRTGKLIAMNKAGLAATRPAGDTATVNDLPDETGAPLAQFGDTHDVLTGSTAAGKFNGTSGVNTCNDWTSASDSIEFDHTVMAGHSWPANSGRGWVNAHAVGGCAPGINLIQSGPGRDRTVGGGGGWGAIYCFALTP